MKTFFLVRTHSFDSRRSICPKRCDAMQTLATLDEMTHTLSVNAVKSYWDMVVTRSLPHKNDQRIFEAHVSFGQNQREYPAPLNTETPGVSGVVYHSICPPHQS